MICDPQVQQPEPRSGEVLSLVLFLWFWFELLLPAGGLCLAAETLGAYQLFPGSAAPAVQYPAGGAALPRHPEKLRCLHQTLRGWLCVACGVPGGRSGSQERNTSYCQGEQGYAALLAQDRGAGIPGLERP